MKTSPAYRSVVLALALLAIPASATASDWSWNFTPYAWTLLGADVDVEVNDRDDLRRRGRSSSDLIDDLDFAFFAHLEGRRGKLGVFADVFVVDLGDEPRNFSLGPLPISAKVGPGADRHRRRRRLVPERRRRLRDPLRRAAHRRSTTTLDIRGVGPLPVDRRIIHARQEPSSTAWWAFAT